jgi:hypothetical protein
MTKEMPRSGTSMSPDDKSLLLKEYAEWASERGLSSDRHEATFHGWLRGANVPVAVETGIRASDLYLVIVTIYLDCGVPLRVLRSDDAREDHENDGPILSSMRALLRRKPSLLAIRIDELAVTLRMRPGTRPADVGDALDEVLPIALSARSIGPYR